MVGKQCFALRTITGRPVPVAVPHSLSAWDDPSLPRGGVAAPLLSLLLPPPSAQSILRRMDECARSSIASSSAATRRRLCATMRLCSPTIRLTPIIIVAASRTIASSSSSSSGGHHRRPSGGWNAAGEATKKKSDDNATHGPATGAMPSTRRTNNVPAATLSSTIRATAQHVHQQPPGGDASGSNLPILDATFANVISHIRAPASASSISAAITAASLFDMAGADAAFSTAHSGDGGGAAATMTSGSAYLSRDVRSAQPRTTRALVASVIPRDEDISRRRLQKESALDAIEKGAGERSTSSRAAAASDQGRMPSRAAEDDADAEPEGRASLQRSGFRLPSVSQKQQQRDGGRADATAPIWRSHRAKKANSVEPSWDDEDESGQIGGLRADYSDMLRERMLELQGEKRQAARTAAYFPPNVTGASANAKDTKVPNIAVPNAAASLQGRVIRGDRSGAFPPNEERPRPRRGGLFESLARDAPPPTTTTHVANAAAGDASSTTGEDAATAKLRNLLNFADSRASDDEPAPPVMPLLPPGRRPLAAGGHRPDDPSAIPLAALAQALVMPAMGSTKLTGESGQLIDELDSGEGLDMAEHPSPSMRRPAADPYSFDEGLNWRGEGASGSRLQPSAASRAHNVATSRTLLEEEDSNSRHHEAMVPTTASTSTRSTHEHDQRSSQQRTHEIEAISDSVADDAAPSQPTDAPMVYLARAVQRAGLCTRKAAFEYVSSGKIRVNGTIERDPFCGVIPDDDITVEGHRGRLRFTTPRLWLFHKPSHVLVGTHDPRGRQLFTRYAQIIGVQHLIPVGSLPLRSHGALLLTNDGDLARFLSAPATRVQSTYLFRVTPPIDAMLAYDLNTRGVSVDGVAVRGFEFTAFGHARSRNVIKIKVQSAGAALSNMAAGGISGAAAPTPSSIPVEQILQHLGRTVLRGGRVSIGPYALHGLAPGSIKEVSVPPFYLSHVNQAWRPFIERDWTFFRRLRVRNLKELSRFRHLTDKERSELDQLTYEDFEATMTEEHVEVRREADRIAQSLARPPSVDGSWPILPEDGDEVARF